MQSIRGSLVKSNVTLDYQDIVPMNATFEMAEDDISLVSEILNFSWSFNAIETNFSLFVTSMDEFDQEAQFMLSRDSTYRIGFRNHKSYNVIFWWLWVMIYDLFLEYEPFMSNSTKAWSPTTWHQVNYWLEKRRLFIFIPINMTFLILFGTKTLF